MQIKSGTKITTYTGGGGGFEKAEERNIADVLGDVKNKYVSIDKAKEDYKVVISLNMEIDDESTKNLRNKN